MRILRIIITALTVWLLLLGLPALYFADRAGLFSDTDIDAVSSASLALPEKPSGACVVFINAGKHPDTLKDWKAFFTEAEVGVIMEDIHCMTADGDAGGRQLAERYLGRLAENQMKLRTEDPSLLISRAEYGLFDVIVLSEEMAGLLDCSSVSAREDTETVIVEASVNPVP